MAAIQDIQNLIARAQPIPLDLQKAALLEAQQQGLDNQALASVFGVPVSMISAAYEANRPAVEPAAIERLTQNQAAPESLSPAATTTISSAISYLRRCWSHFRQCGNKVNCYYSRCYARMWGCGGYGL